MEDSKNNVIAIRNKFRQMYERGPRIFRAPGRVNLIGEHTDYNDGFVLPCAIDRETLVAGASRSDTKIELHALDIEESFLFDLRDAAVKERGNWIDYVEGIARCLQKRFDIVKGANLIFSSTVPIGGGLSSSAGLEVSIGYALLSLNDVQIDRRALALAAQEAEHNFVGIRSGIMDQFASVFCQKDHALLLDCRTLETRQIPLDLGNAAIVICDTKIKHELASSEYNKRRAECESGVEIMRKRLPDVRTLRDVTEPDFEKVQDILPDVLKKRCRHVITENARTLAASESLRRSDIRGFGKLMFRSHESLRDDYEVSSVELDTLVETARNVEGVYGARMTGGGFGGCTVNFVDTRVLEEFRKLTVKEYFERFGFEPAMYVVEPSDGACEIA